MLDLLPNKNMLKERMKAIILSLSIDITSGHELQINSLDHANIQCFQNWSTLKKRASEIRKQIDEEATSERDYTIMRDLISLKNLSCILPYASDNSFWFPMYDANVQKKNILLVQV